ncbi:MAG: TRAP transporter small permease [Burkholderiales bacterium]
MRFTASRAWTLLDTALDILTAASFLVMALTLTLQIVARYVLNWPLAWPEEFSILLFAWSVWLGGAGGMREGRQIRIDVIDSLAPASVRRVLEPALTMLSLAFLAVVIWYGVKVTESQSTAEYDILPVSRAVLYVVAPVMGSIMALYLLRILARQLGLVSDPGPGQQ